jgi:hypothetical protein
MEAGNSSPEAIDEGVGSLGLCRMIESARAAFVMRFKAFLAKNFGGIDLGVDFGALRFSAVSGEGGQFLRVEGLNDYPVSVEGVDVSFSQLCSTEGLRVTPRGALFELEIPVDLFDSRPAVKGQMPEQVNVASQVGVSGAGEVPVAPLSEATRVWPTAQSPGSVAGAIQERVSSAVPELPPRRDDESMGFVPGSIG